LPAPENDFQPFPPLLIILRKPLGLYPGLHRPLLLPGKSPAIVQVAAKIIVLPAPWGETAPLGEGKEAAGPGAVLINGAAVGRNKWATLCRIGYLQEDQGQVRSLFGFSAGVTPEKLPGSNPQALFQAQEVIGA
jgi:hypothetical protein